MVSFVYPAKDTSSITPVTFSDSDLSELLEALKAGEISDRVRSSLEWILQALIEAETTAVIGAAPHERTAGRTNQRNGHRPKLMSTAAGDVELEIPKLRHGSFFPSLLERRRRIDRALFAVVMEAYVHGVSTRKVDDLVKALGIASGISRSEVSRICSELDGDLEAFRTRRLDHAEFPYVFADATYLKGRVGGRSVSRAVVIATGVSANGDREVLGLEVGDSEDGAFWTGFLRSLRARGLTGSQVGDLRPPSGAETGDWSGVRGFCLAKVQGALHAQRPGQGAPRISRDGGSRHPDDLRPARRRALPLPADRGIPDAAEQLPSGGGHAR